MSYRPLVIEAGRIVQYSGDEEPVGAEPRFAGAPNGFADRAEVTLTWDDGTRTATITPVGEDFTIWSDGTKYVFDEAQSFTIDDVEGDHFIYFDADGVLQDSSSFLPALISTYCFVVFLYWDATNKRAPAGAINETHGVAMDPVTHAYLHSTVGTRYDQGLTPTVTSDGNGSADGHAQAAFASGVIWDEDIKHTLAEKLAASNHLLIWREGASGLWRGAVTPFVVTTAGTGRAAWNEWTGATWQLTEAGNAQYVLAHVFAVPGLTYGILVLVGQAVYGNVTAARTGALTELSDLSTGTLPVTEFSPICTLILQTGNYANSVKSRIAQTADGDDYVDWRTSGPSASSGASASDHNGLAGIQGGTPGEYYHLDATDYAAALTIDALTAGYVPKADATGLANSPIYVDSNGRVGIGTTNPTVGYALHVAGNISASYVSAPGNVDTNLVFCNTVTAPSTATPSMNLGPAGDLTLLTNYAARLTVKVDGSIGIGTTSADGVEIATPIATNTYLGRDTLRMGVKTTPRIIFEHDNTNWEIDNYLGSFRMFHDGTVYVTVTSDGRVGIGTGSPDLYKLYVNGTQYVSSALTVGGSISTLGSVTATGNIAASGTLTGVNYLTLNSTNAGSEGAEIRMQGGADNPETFYIDRAGDALRIFNTAVTDTDSWVQIFNNDATYKMHVCTDGTVRAGYSAVTTPVAELECHGRFYRQWLVKITTYTAQKFEQVLANATGGSWTLTLPASPSAGDTVKIKAAVGAGYTLTINGNSANIRGSASDLTISGAAYQDLELVYLNASAGWV